MPNSEGGAGRPPVVETFLRLAALMRGSQGLLWLSIGLGVVSAVTSLSPHLAVALTLVELVSAAPRAGQVLLYAGCGAVGVAISHVCYGAAMLVSHRIAFSVQYDLRALLAEKLARVPLGFFDTQSKGGLRTALFDDVNQVEDGMAHLVPETTAAFVTPFVVFLGMALLDWRIALVALLPTLAGIWLVGRLVRAGGEVTRRHAAASARMNAVVGEIAEGLSTLRAFDQERQALARVRATMAESRQVALDWIRRSLAPASVAQTLLVANLALVVPLGLVLHQLGQIALPALIVLFVLAIGLGDLFAGIAGLAHRIARQRAVLDRLDAILVAPELPVSDTPGNPEGTRVEIAGLGLDLGGRRVLDGIDLVIEPGELIALVGPSGAGKSTLARMLARFHDPDRGRIRIGGVDIREIAPDRLSALIGIVFQEVFLFEGTIAENIGLGCAAASREEIVAAAKAAQAHGFVMALPNGYDTELGEGGSGLSGGERQRLSIARAILKDAPILLLDEATAFADPENEALVQHALSRLTAGRTVIVIAHRLRSITQADRIVVLDCGRLVEQGRHKALIEREGLYAALWRAQNPGPAAQARLEHSA